jgi:hypothetical protein
MFTIWGTRFRIWDLGFGFKDSGSRILGVGFRPKAVPSPPLDLRASRGLLRAVSRGSLGLRV